MRFKKFLKFSSSKSCREASISKHITSVKAFFVKIGFESDVFIMPKI